MTKQLQVLGHKEIRDILDVFFEIDFFTKKTIQPLFAERIVTRQLQLLGHNEIRDVFRRFDLTPLGVHTQHLLHIFATHCMIYVNDIYIYMCVCIFMYICVYIHKYVYIYIHVTHVLNIFSQQDL